MKKCICVVSALLVLVLGMTACGKVEVDEVQDDLVKYVNTDLPAIKPEEKTALDAYQTLCDNVSTLAQPDILTQLNDTIIPNYTNFVNKLAALTPASEEVKNCQATYLAGAQKQLEGLQQLSAAVANSDSTEAEAAQSTINEGKVKIQEHRTMLMDVANNHNVELEVTK